MYINDNRKIKAKVNSIFNEKGIPVWSNWIFHIQKRKEGGHTQASNVPNRVDDDSAAIKIHIIEDKGATKEWTVLQNDMASEAN